MSGYEIQSAAAGLLNQDPQALRAPHVSTAVPVGTYEKGGERFYYPTVEESMATEVLADCLPYAKEHGVTDEEFEAIDRYSEDMAGIGVILVDGIADAGVDLSLDDSLQVQAQLIRTFAEARRKTIGVIQEMTDAERKRYQNAEVAPGSGVVGEDFDRDLVAGTSAIVKEMIGGLPTKLKLPEDEVSLCRQHFIWAEFYGVNSALAENDFPYYY